MTAKRIRGRKLQAMRDRLFSHQPLCVMCATKDIVRLAEERDHIVPLHKGGLDRESNTQALCKECHEEKTITEQGMHYSPRKSPGLDWVTQRPMTSVTIISGLPGAGKTTYVQQHMTSGDLVVDMDAIFAAISLLPQHDCPEALLPFAASARDAIIYRLSRPSNVAKAWIITTDPVIGAALASQLKGKHIHLEIDETERLTRLYQRRADAISNEENKGLINAGGGAMQAR